MSYLDPVYTQCEDLQGRLSSVWADPGNQREIGAEPLAFLSFVRSPENVNGINQIVSPGGGKAVDIRLVFDRPILESSVTEFGNRACRPQEKRGDASALYTIDTNEVTESGERFAIADFTRKCENNSTFLARRILQHMVAIDKAVATKIATQAVALYGDYSADVVSALSLNSPDTLEVQTTDTNGNYKAGAFERIQWATQSSQFPMGAIFGGRLLNEHFRLAQAGCCTNWGINVAELLAQFGVAIAYDRRVATAMGSISDANLFAGLGVYQLLTYIENPGVRDLGSLMPGGYVYTEAVTPSGVPVEITIKDDCKVLDIQVQTAVKLVALPTDMYEVGDNFAGTNGAAKILVVNP
jgi:hypothetical protein